MDPRRVVGSLLIATYSLFQFAGAPVLDRLSDERGRRPVLLLSLFGSVVAWTLFGVAGELGSLVGVTNGLAVLFLARALAGAMGGNIATANAYMADIAPLEDRAQGLGILGAAFGLTQSAGSLARTVGPALAGLLYVVDYWSPFVAAGLVFVPVLVLLGRVASEQVRPATS
ncbi:MAG: MFS transporter [Haloarculaceae archaeon]